MTTNKNVELCTTGGNKPDAYLGAKLCDAEVNIWSIGEFKTFRFLLTIFNLQPPPLWSMSSFLFPVERSLIGTSYCYPSAQAGHQFFPINNGAHFIHAAQQVGLR